MTEFEIRSLIYEETQIAANEFEFWLMASFAVVLAGYYAFRYLEPRLQRTVIWLYLVTAAVFVIRWFVSIFKMYEYQMALLELEIDFGVQVGAGLATLLQTGLMLFGTLAVASFLKRVGQANEPTDT